jgi:hypothetical protein
MERQDMQEAWKMRNSYKVLVGKSEGKILLQ